MINKKQFGRIFAERYGIAYQEAEEICKKTFALLASLIYEQKEDVVINGFGSFKHKKAKAKNVRHPRTGEVITRPEHNFIKFTLSESLNMSKYKNEDSSNLKNSEDNLRVV